MYAATYFKRATVYALLYRQRRAVKVGIASNLTSRLGTYRTCCPDPLIVLAKISAGDWNECWELERRVHKEMAPWRLTGEWYRWCADSKKKLAELLGVRRFPAEMTI